MSPAAPSAEELAAIVAAVEMCWPRPSPAAAPAAEPAPPWRFSGRWWAQPQALRRQRPWAAGRSR